MSLWRKVPVEVEAVQYANNEWADTPYFFAEPWPEWVKQAILDKRIKAYFGSEDYWYLIIETLNGPVTMGPDEWLIQGVDGEIYPCAPNIFRATYEPVG